MPQARSCVPTWTAVHRQGRQRQVPQQPRKLHLKPSPHDTDRALVRWCVQATQHQADSAESGVSQASNSAVHRVVPDVVDVDAVVVEEGGTGNSAEVEDDDDISAAAREARERKSSILLELCQAGEQIEDKIAEWQHEIDEVLLGMFYKRIETAKKFAEDEQLVRGMTLLFNRLRYEVERKRATPAERLLNDCLNIMNSRVGSAQEMKQLLIERLMQSFSPIAAAEDFDLFAAAAALAEQRDQLEEAADYVSRQQFVQETQAYIDHGMRRASEFESMLKRKESEVENAQRAGQPAEAVNKLRTELQEMARELLNFKATVAQVKDVVGLANRLDLP